MWGREKWTHCSFSILMQTSALQTNTMADLGLSERPWHEFGHIPALKQLLWNSKVSAGCWSPTTALSWCPCLPSASGPRSAGSHLPCSLEYASSLLQAWGLSSVAWFASIHLDSLPFSCPFPASNKFPSPRFLGTKAHQCHHKAFPRRMLSPVGKTMARLCQQWHSECGTSQGFRTWPVPAYRCSLATFACGEPEPDGSPSVKGKSVLFKLGTQHFFCQIWSLFFHSMWS